MRFFGLVSLVASLCVGMFLFAAQMRGVNGEVGPQGGGAREDAQIASATFVARRADTVLDVYRTQAGTYVGADLSGVDGVEIVRSDATSYCLKIRAPGGDLYEQGPGGDVGTDAC